MPKPSLEATLEQARALISERKVPAAIALLEPLAAREPAPAAAAFLLGTALAAQRDFAGARRQLERSFAADPHQPAPHLLVYANVLLDSGDLVSAEATAREVLRAKPGWAPALNTLGLVLRARNRADEAIAAFRAVVAAEPGHPAHRALARLLHQRAALGEAIEHYHRALATFPDDADLWNELGVALTDSGHLEEARNAYREALERRPSYHQVESNLLINLHYDPGIDAEAMFQAHRAWAERHAADLPRLVTAGPGTRPAKLRIGFLAPAFTAGPTATFVRPLLVHLDRAKFEAAGFNVGRSDAASDTLRGLTESWHELWGAGDEEVARLIAEERIDILVDLAGHTPGGRPLVLARKPAPVIATWLDYFDTTGLDAVDYLIGDPVSTPEDGAQRFSERVVRLSPVRLCYDPPPYAPEPAPAPMLRKGFATFGSFNRLSKIAAPVIDLWAEVLRSAPEAHLLLKNAALSDEATRETVLRNFAARGISRERIELRGPTPHAQMLAEYGDVDIALDTFPYNGGLTTCEALWMGVPVLAVRGGAMISRQSAALLAAAGLSNLVCATGADLVAVAASLARDRERLEYLRESMRERLAASALLDAPGFARQFEAALERMWRERSAA